MSPAPDYFTALATQTQAAPRRAPEPQSSHSSTDWSDSDSSNDSETYCNARLDPANFLEGPLSTNPATRLRQMLARPGIVVC